MSDALTASEASNWSLIQRLLGMSWRYRWGCVKVLVYQTILLSFGLFGLGYTGLGIDEIRHRVDPSVPAPHWPFNLRPPESWDGMLVIGVVAFLVLGLACTRAALNYLYTVAVNHLVQGDIVVQLRADLYDKMQRLSFRFYDANASSSIINRVTGDVQAVRSFVDQVLIQILIMILSLAVFLIYMVNIHIGLTVACLASTPLLWIASGTFSRVVQPGYVRNRELLDALIQRFLENFRGISVVKAFAREPDEIREFREANQMVTDQQHGVFRQVGFFMPMIGFISQINLMILLGYGGYLVINGRLALGTGLVVFAGILQQFSGQVANVANIANSMQQSLAAARRVFEVLDAPVAIESPAVPRRIESPRGEVRFEHVWFDHGLGPVLEDVDFAVEPGTCVGIVGPTGAGKSALTSLVPRFYDPTGGRVVLDGVDLRELDLDQLRRSVGLVFQESFLFSTTIAANIAFGYPDATQEQIERAARIAAAHDFIMEQPEGYETVLGEGGVGLSGGQRQRLAIARAVLLEPAILLLDDPTAAVDPGTETEIVEAMESAMKSRTTFLVASRMSVLRRADRVIVLDHGRVVQKGTPGDLLKEEGYFREIAIAQGMRL